MPRAPRIEIAGGTHHVTARTPSGRWLFTDEEERRVYLALVEKVIASRGWSVFNFCLMGNHVHLLIRTPEPDLGAGMKQAHERFAVFVNDRRGEHGHLFGGRFYSGPVLEEGHFAASMRYISRNPVAAGLCAGPADWEWSGHNTLMGRQGPLDALDVEGAFTVLHDRSAAGRLAYATWAARPDQSVLDVLEASLGEAWLASAVDAHGVPPETVMRVKGWGRTAYYRRLAASRRTLGSVPPVRRVLAGIG